MEPRYSRLWPSNLDPKFWIDTTLSLSLSLSVLTTTFPGEPGLAGCVLRRSGRQEEHGVDCHEKLLRQI